MRRYYTFFALKTFLIGLVASSFLLMPFHSNALTLDSARDCDDNAILRCGALTTAELQDKYQSSGMGPVYARFGITGQEIQNMNTNSDAEHIYSGIVTRSGNVIVDQISINGQTYSNKVVATDALTAGRQNITGSTAESSGGINFYVRPPSVSFVSSSLPAFVVMENGRFAYAIIASCGNPVKASATVFPKPVPTPVPKPSPKHTPTPTPSSAPPVAPTPSPTPAAPTPVAPASITITNSNTQSQSQSQSHAQGGTGGETQSQPAATAAAAATTPSATTASQASAPAGAPAVTTSTPAPSGKRPSTLPNTGPSGAVAISGISTVFATLGHFFMRLRKMA